MKLTVPTLSQDPGAPFSPAINTNLKHDKIAYDSLCFIWYSTDYRHKHSLFTIIISVATVSYCDISYVYTVPFLYFM